jgi:hypothetical protein
MKKLLIGLLALESVSAFAASSGEYKLYVHSTLAGLPSASSFSSITDMKICHSLGQADAAIHGLEQALLSDTQISEKLSDEVTQIALNVKGLTGFCIGKSEANGGTPGGPQPTTVVELGAKRALGSAVQSVENQVRDLLTKL